MDTLLKLGSRPAHLAHSPDLSAAALELERTRAVIRRLAAAVRVHYPDLPSGAEDECERSLLARATGRWDDPEPYRQFRRELETLAAVLR